LFKKDIKYKLLTLDELIISLDRLSRFKPPEESYNRVFSEILVKCLVYPQFSLNEIKNLDGDTISKLVSIIWNSSVKKLFDNFENNFNTQFALKSLSIIPFKNIDTRTKKMLNTKLVLSPILEKINYETAPLNLKFLIRINKDFDNSKKLNQLELLNYSNRNNLRYPITKLIIVEGITEEILLPVFASKLNYNFDSNGIFILGAGGKSKSPTLYMKLKDSLTIPVILLFDKDAFEICNMLNENILKKDKIILLEKGEFEDIISINLIKRTLNNEYNLVSPAKKNDLIIFDKMADNLDNFYRTRKIGEFKKAKFSKLLTQNIKYNTDITIDIKNLVTELY